MQTNQQFCLKHQSGEDIYLFALHNSRSATVLISNYGAIITSIQLMRPDESVNDIVLGFDTMQDYLHPTYLSREFSKYFDNLSFGDYIRKLRIEKSIALLKDQKYSLAEIAYLTGFSDQSHFNRIFKLHTGKSPAHYRKNLVKP